MKKSDREVLFSHKKDDWETPDWLFNHLDKKYNFTLDPATSGYNSKCKKFYTSVQDGLIQSWKGETVFLNPPYSKTYEWIKKAHKEATENDVTTVILIPSRTCTKYWHDFIMDPEICSEICFIKGRLKFSNSDTPAPFPSVLLTFGPKSYGRKSSIVTSLKQP